MPIERIASWLEHIHISGPGPVNYFFLECDIKPIELFQAKIMSCTVPLPLPLATSLPYLNFAWQSLIRFDQKFFFFFFEISQILNLTFLRRIYCIVLLVKTDNNNTTLLLNRQYQYNIVIGPTISIFCIVVTNNNNTIFLLHRQ